MKYKTLNHGAKIKEGDEFYSESRKLWKKTTLAGFIVIEGTKYRRPIKPKKKGSK